MTAATESSHCTRTFEKVSYTLVKLPVESGHRQVTAMAAANLVLSTQSCPSQEPYPMHDTQNEASRHCECSCLGEMHGGCAPSGRWYELSETFATLYGVQKYSVRTFIKRKN